MSCGNPHDVDCQHVLEQVYLYLDGELADEDCAEIRQHLDECSPCLKKYGLEQAVKALVARSCGCDVAPVEVRERLVIRLQTVRLELGHVEFRAD